jgi:hypothetical protein
MNRRLTLALLVIFVVLIAAAWYLDRPQTLAPFWTITAEDITEVRFEDLKNKDVSAVDLRKDPEGKWILYGMLNGDSRLSREANQETVATPISQIAQISPSGDFGDNLNLTDFGLDQTGYLLTVKTSDGNARTLEIARDLTPSKTGFYVLTEGSKRVYTVPKAVLQSFVDYLLDQPVLATVTPPPATDTPPASETTPAETGVLPTATATPAP